MSSLSRVSNIVKMLSDKFNFDLDEGLRMVGVEKKEKNSKKIVNKDMILLPFSNEKDMSCCSGIRKASGLYLQCTKGQDKDSDYCKGCKKECEVNGTGKPDFGTIEDRLSCGLYDFRDPKGKSPIGYLKYLSKVKKSKEEAEVYALKENKTILAVHFEYEDSKRGRPKTEKKVKESTGKKGRPKKSKKEVELAGEEEDLFALLIEDANSTNVNVNEVEEGEVVEVAVEEAVEEAVKVVEVAVEVAEKVEKKTKKADKEAEKQKKLAEKEAEKQKKLAEKEAEKQKKLAEKEAEKQKKLAEKEEEKKNKKPSTKKSEKKVIAAVQEVIETVPPKEEEQDVVRKFEYEGVTYLKSKFTGVIYNMDQELIGKWNEETKKIDFEEFDDEEEEDEYDE